MPFPESMKTYAGQIETALESVLPTAGGPNKTLAEAMRYAVLGGGKRLRPITAMATCEACGGLADDVLQPAAALELIHVYSLIHDDLPAMDDDDLRRGKPTLHRQFSEATAVLAGDALHSLAFELLASFPHAPDAVPRRLAAVSTLARSAGISGMAGGQIADLEAERSPVDADGLSWIHRHKTGALFAASAEIGAIHAGADSVSRNACARYGHALGLAFQIADDILDQLATADDLGKTPGKDLQTGKATYPALFGLDGAREHAARCIEDALKILRPQHLLTPTLEELARFAISRTH
jgi:geranylgeranyl pyrophosphate synthase